MNIIVTEADTDFRTQLKAAFELDGHAVLEASDGDARNYANQLKNTGQFLWRHKREDVLLKSLRDAVVKKSGHYYEQGLDSPALIHSLSQSSGLELELVTEAMTGNDVRDASTMVKITKTLQQILNSL